MERRSKYNARKTTVSGIQFDSAAEARRYQELILLERNGDIYDLTLQPTFELQPKFDYNGEKIRSIKYVADFSHFVDGRQIIEDVKGMRTDVYSLKRKMFLRYLKQYPNIKFVEVE